MFIRYSVLAKNVIAYSKEYRKKLGHRYCGTEHILIGLVNINTGGLASKALNNIGVTEEKVLKEIEELIGVGKTKYGISKLTPRTKIVIRMSYKECMKMNERKVKPEHILLALMKEGESLAVRILVNLFVEPRVLFEEIVKVLKEDMIL